MTRRLLVVAYFFPPVVSVGVERTLKHVTYLPEAGWSPVVIGPATPAYRSVDPATLDRVPIGTAVRRAPSLEPGHLRAAARWLRGTAGRRPAGDSSPAPRADEVARHGGRDWGMKDLVNAAWAWAIPLVYFPDEQILWAPGAIAAGLAADRERAVDVIYSSSPPISSHLAAAVLSRLTGAPWVADFRDPWIGNAFARPLPPPHRAAQRAVERLIVENAHAVVFASGRVRDRYAERYPGHAERFAVIRNGYDLAELEEAERIAGDVPPEESAFRLTYSGSIHGPGELPLFLDGLELALKEDPGLRARLRVDFVGYFSADNRRLAERRFPVLAPVVRHLGLRPRLEALARLMAADAALYLLADGPDRDLAVGSKLYEYIGLNRQVLAVAPPGESRDVLAALKWGVAADPTPRGVADGLHRLLELPAPDRVADPERRFERRELTRQLAELLGGVLEAAEARSG